MADVNDRKRIRCVPCNLVQFVNKSHTCVKCKQPFNRPKAPPVVQVKPVVVVDLTGVKLKTEAYWLPLALAYVRTKHGLSEREVAARAGFQRTYISKVENGSALPTLSTIPRYCEALNVEPVYLIRITEFLVWGK